MRIIAVTACPTGIAHSQMAAENLETAAEEMGHDVHVEIQGAMGTENEISDDDVAAADVVIVASDTTVRTDRFGDTPVVKGAVKDAVNDAEGMIREAEEKVEAGGGAAAGADESTTAGTETSEATSEAESADGSAASADDGAASAGASASGDDAGADRRSSGGAADDREHRQGLVGKIKSLFS